MDRIIAEIGEKKVSYSDFFNTFFSLLVGYSIFGNIGAQKLGRSDVDKFSKIMFDLTLESVISTVSIREMMRMEKGVSFEISRNLDEGERLRELIRDRLVMIGEEKALSYLDPAVLQEIVDTQSGISEFIQNYLTDEGILSYEGIEKYYTDTFKGFLFLSFIFVSIPKLLRRGDKEEIRRKIREEDPVAMEKQYEKDPEKIVYYYEDIDVFDYFTSSGEFGSQKMYMLQDILEGVGVVPENMVLDERIKGEVIRLDSEKRENYYRFTRIDYDKPSFDDKIYGYIREIVLESLYDEVLDKMYDEAMDKVRIRYYDENIKELERLVRPISRKWFENLGKVY